MTISFVSPHPFFVSFLEIMMIMIIPSSSLFGFLPLFSLSFSPLLFPLFFPFLSLSPSPFASSSGRPSSFAPLTSHLASSRRWDSTRFLTTCTVGTRVDLAPAGIHWHSLEVVGSRWYSLAPVGTLWHPLACTCLCQDVL